MLVLGMTSIAQTTANAQTYITGSPTLRQNFYAAATTPGGIFDSNYPVTVLPASANADSMKIVYNGKINGVLYNFSCAWTSTEAGIANAEGCGGGYVTSVPNPGLPNDAYGSAASLPGVEVNFLWIDGTTNSFTSQADLVLTDYSQAVSLTRPPAHGNLLNYGPFAVVPYVWVKGKNGSTSTTDPGDVAWSRLANITHHQLIIALGSTVNANFLTGNAADSAIPVAMIGASAACGSRVNALADVNYGITTGVTQFGVNSTYSAAGVLTYNIVPNNQAATYPSVASSLSNQTNFMRTPNLFSDGNDGYDDGSDGVSYCLSCDLAGSEIITLGSLGINDAKACRDGKPNTAPTPNQPGGAVWLTLDGVPENDAAVVNGSYTFWGHAYLYLGACEPNPIYTGIAATNIMLGLAAKGNFGTGSATAESAAISYAAMLADRPSQADTGYVQPF